ncbi:MAG: dTDP-4-dehydrorhamnose 3,5-epimerase family protein [Patescibacteria group bacterium]
MKILGVEELEIPEIKVISFQRFKDNRGYFTETYRKSDFETNSQTEFLQGIDFTQVNESFSKKGVVRGLHFQWDPYMAKMLRVIQGSVIDVALDIRPNSPTFGKIVGYEFNMTAEDDENKWIWVPVGFAHGLYFLEESTIEYFCTGQWAPDTERAISPIADDIDWSIMNTDVKSKIEKVIKEGAEINEKDTEGMSLSEWMASDESSNFTSSDL